MAGEWKPAGLTPQDESRIEAVVARLESKTTAELVPVIVKSSSTTGHLPFQIALILWVVALALSWPFAPELMVADRVWILALLFLLTGALAYPLAQWPFLQRILIPNADEIEQVWRRAWAEFSHFKLSSTQSRAGVLVLVSVMERRAVLLVDEALSKDFPPELCEKLVGVLTGKLRQGQWAGAFEALVEEMEPLLAKAAPRNGPAGNQLSNHLRIKI